MKVLVTGYNGQLGYDVVRECEKHGIEAIGIDVQQLDITNEAAVKAYMEQIKPTILIHCAAYTAVDKAEDDIETCEKVNVAGTRYLAQACQELAIPMMYFSTDYVFSGNGETPFEIDGEIAPTSVYGRTKWEGEEVVRQLVAEHFIIRISWVFGENGNNFIKTMLRLGSERTELNVIADQIGSPTYTADLAKLVVDMMQTKKYGTYHASNEGFCSWADFAKEIFMIAGLDVIVHPIPTEQYPTRATRPKNSRMSKQALVENGFTLLPTWQDATKHYIDILQNEK